MSARRRQGLGPERPPRTQPSPAQRCDLGSHSLCPSIRPSVRPSSDLAGLREDERGCGQLPWALDSHLIVNEASSVPPAQALPSSHPSHRAESCLHHASPRAAWPWDAIYVCVHFSLFWAASHAYSNPGVLGMIKCLLRGVTDLNIAPHAGCHALPPPPASSLPTASWGQRSAHQHIQED